eukprot:989003-Prymnesium_polylepis.1
MRGATARARSRRTWRPRASRWARAGACCCRWAQERRRRAKSAATSARATGRSRGSRRARCARCVS